MAFILEFLGGLFIVGGSVLGALAYSGYPYGPGGLYAMLELASASLGVIVILAASMTYVVPSQHVAWGVVTLVCSVASVFLGIGSVYGGFFVGMVLGIVGGSLGIAWKPVGAPGFMSYRVCLACGRHVPIEYPLCPFCGTPAPVWTAGAGPVGPRPPFPPSP